MFPDNHKHIYRELIQSENLKKIYSIILKKGFLFDDPEYSATRFIKLIDYFEINNPREWFNNREDELQYIDFMNLLLINNKNEGWRLGFTGCLNFWIMFSKREQLNEELLVNHLNWELDIARVFMTTVNSFN